MKLRLDMTGGRGMGMIANTAAPKGVELRYDF